MKNIFEQLTDLLKKDERLASQDGVLLKNQTQELARKNDPVLIKLLLSGKAIKQHFFFSAEGGSASGGEVSKVLIFDKEKFIRFVSNKQFLPDSYTAFKNKIGLTAGDEYLSENKEVVLAWPYKDCVLEGGMTKEDQKRDEIFYNETLAPDDINRLLDAKVFTNFKRIDKKGEHNLDGFKRDEKGTIKDNLIIKGNNLLALASLKKEFAGKVKLIYIDPPYYFNGLKSNDSFAYNTNFKLSSWLVFMKNRLNIARDLLLDSGMIFIQISDEGMAHLKLLADEVFQPSNYINTITVKAKASSGASGGGEDKKMKKNSEFILLYSKNKMFFEYKPMYTAVPIEKYIEDHKQDEIGFYYTRVLTNEGKKEFVKEIDGIKVYKHTDFKFDTIRDFMKAEKLTYNEAYSKYFNKIFMVTNAQTSILGKVNNIIGDKDKLVSYEYVPKSGRNKNKKTVKYIWNKTLVVWFSDSAVIKNGQVSKLEEIGSLWTDISWGRLDIEGGVKFKSGKKPEVLIQRIVELATKPGDIVIDYHLGSGTTCAVAHKMGRQYIGIEQIEYNENDSVIRLKNVINGDQTGISKSVEWKGGENFVYMEIAKWNEEWIEKIRGAKTGKELAKLWDEMKKTAFLSYKVNPKSIDENAKDFAGLSIADQKKFLIECLDKNQLYVNYSEIEDKDYQASKEDIKSNKEFYG
ncbi:MAG: site-specific DNA-methyltransferase [bacterium]|nr:site-specific DNA-methyltransferase [bacterium]